MIYYFLDNHIYSNIIFKKSILLLFDVKVLSVQWLVEWFDRGSINDSISENSSFYLWVSVSGENGLLNNYANYIRKTYKRYLIWCK